MQVLFAASEAVPFVKTGGLGEVIGSLPKELKKCDVETRIIMPKYGSIPNEFKSMIKVVKRFSIKIGDQDRFCGLEKIEYNGITFYFIDNEYYFKRENLYGYWDDGERFSFFCRAVLESLPYLNFVPQIIHCHDWHSAMINVLLKIQYGTNSLYNNINNIFTIHNLKFQGIFPADILNLLHIKEKHFNCNELEFFGKVNFLKGALVHSDLITTVSKTYSEEIKHQYFGENLDVILREKNSKLHGIINGINYDDYNPSTDSHIFKNYDYLSLSKKMQNKYKLQQLLGLPKTNKVPILTIISRLTSQKGLDLIKHFLDEILQMELQMVVLGVGDSGYEKMFIEAQKKYPKKLSANIFFDDKLARRIYAGGDFFLMPSLFEPCGLGQLIALRYGNIPVVRETGGLNDTVLSYDEISGEGNGFSFKNYNADDMLYTINRAISFFHNKPVWTKIRKKAMTMDYSWKKSANQYVELYTKLLHM